MAVAVLLYYWVFFTELGGFLDGLSSRKVDISSSRRGNVGFATYSVDSVIIHADLDGIRTAGPSGFGRRFGKSIIQKFSR